MRILVTNDDGIESEGIHVLAQQLSELGDVTVFAPSGEYSGAGAAIGHLAQGLPDVFQVTRDEMADVGAIYHFDGPPALAALLSCQGIFGAAPDIVVSGINPGWNVGHAVHFSGTIGACVTASVFGIAAIAISQHTGGGPMHWQTAALAAADHIERARTKGLLLNINVPNLATADIEGVVDTELADRIPYSLHSPSIAEISAGRYTASFQTQGPFDGPPGTDTHAVESGFISVTPLTPTHASE